MIKRYRSQRDYIKHRSRSHPTNSSPQVNKVPFGCNLCNFSSFSIRKYLLHVKEKHFVPPSTKTEGDLEPDKEQENNNSTTDETNNNVNLDKSDASDNALSSRENKTTINDSGEKSLEDGHSTVTHAVGKSTKEPKSDDQNVEVPSTVEKSEKDIVKSSDSNISPNSVKAPLLETCLNDPEIERDKLSTSNKYAEIKSLLQINEKASVLDAESQNGKEDDNMDESYVSDEMIDSKLPSSDLSNGSNQSVDSNKLTDEQTDKTPEKFAGSSQALQFSKDKVSPPKNKSCSKLENIVHSLKGNLSSQSTSNSDRSNTSLSPVNEPKEHSPEATNSGVLSRMLASPVGSAIADVSSSLPSTALPANHNLPAAKVAVENQIVPHTAVTFIPDALPKTQKLPPQNTAGSGNTLNYNTIQDPRDLFATCAERGIVSFPNMRIISYIDSNPNIRSVLLHSFSKFPYPPVEEIFYLANATKLSVPQIKNWFVGARTKFGISWSPDEVMEAWSFVGGQQVGITPQQMSSPPGVNVPGPSVHNPMQKPVQMMITDPPSSSFPANPASTVWMTCNCGLEHELNASQIGLLNNMGDSINEMPNSMVLQNAKRVTALPLCAVQSFFQGKCEINNKQTANQGGLDVLYESFCIEPYPKDAELQRIKIATGMGKTAIRDYFLNKRKEMQERLKQASAKRHQIAVYENYTMWTKNLEKSRSIHQQAINICSQLK